MKAILLTLVLMFTLFTCQTGNKKSKIQVIQKTSSNPFEDYKNTHLSSGNLMRLDSFPSKFIKPRPVDVWLPEDYSEEKKYAVLYMHDGQMLFDSTSTWNKQEWKVDEWSSNLNKHGKTKDYIVVAIHNIAELRWQDLFPEKAFNYLEEDTMVHLLNGEIKSGVQKDLNGDNYLKFLTEELKPIIDQNFSVYTNKENTYVMGSSMGGLMSMYAICEYPDYFEGAACISTHWPGAKPIDNNPIGKAILKYMEANLPNPKNHHIYFDYGTETLDAFYPKYAPMVSKILTSKGYTELNFTNKMFKGTDHSENSWNKRLSIPLTFLLKKGG